MNAAAATAPAPLATRFMNRPARDGLALERTGHLPVERVLGLLLPVAVGHGRFANPYGELSCRQRTVMTAKRSSPRGAVRAGLTTSIRTSQAVGRELATTAQAAARRAAAAPASCARALALASAWASLEPQPTADRAGLPHGVGQLSVRRGVRLGDQRDHVGELGDSVEVAERGQPRKPQRVQLVAEQQRQIGSSGCAPPAARRSAAASPRGSSRAAARTRASRPAARGPAAAICAGPGRSTRSRGRPRGEPRRLEHFGHGSALLGERLGRA